MDGRGDRSTDSVGARKGSLASVKSRFEPLYQKEVNPLTERLFICSLSVFVCGWSIVALLYFSQVIPALRQRSGLKPVLQSIFQVNFSGHIREYGALAKKENNKK